MAVLSNPFVSTAGRPSTILERSVRRCTPSATFSIMWTRWLRPDPDGDAPDLPLQLTAITLLLRPFDVWWVSGFVLLGAGLSLLFAPARRTPAIWLALSALIGARIVAVWPLSD